MLLDKLIHASRISLQRPCAVLRSALRHRAPRPARSPECEICLSIGTARRQKSRKVAPRGAPQQIHLPQTILRHHIALRFHHIFQQNLREYAGCPSGPARRTRRACNPLTTMVPSTCGSGRYTNHQIPLPCGNQQNYKHQKVRRRRTLRKFFLIIMRLRSSVEDGFSLRQRTSAPAFVCCYNAAGD